MKKLIPLMLVLAQIFLSGGTPLWASADTTDIIVELEPVNAENTAEYAKNCADILSKAIPTLKCDYIYDTLLCGFSAIVSGNAVWRIKSFDFVKKVYDCAEYEPLDAQITDNDMSAAALINHSAAEAAGLTGNGVKVAVLDSGFDIDHPAFAGEVTETLNLSEFEYVIGVKRLSALQNSTDIAPLYHNSKIPFMYDYASKDADVYTASTNHGTHVAGIIGAGKTDIGEMYGIAPGCQLLLMKIFNDDGKTASDKALIAALEDAIKLGADIINLSIGHYSGSVDPTQIVGLDALLKKAEESGCIIIGAAGNESVTTERSALNENHGIALPPAGYTDYGTLCSPSSVDSIMSVASVNNSIYYSLHFRHSENRELFVEYTDTNMTLGVTDIPFGEYFGGKTLEYEVVPGVGEEKDYEGINVSGKLALVERGVIPFTEKVAIAAAHGAIGVIVYNNAEENPFNMEITGASIPAVGISQKDGKALIAEAVHRLKFPENYTTREIGDDAGKISSYSSYGTTPSLTLKPDISAVGGGVLSTISGGYGASSGTSMAAPQISGACALLIESERKNGTSDRTEIISAVRNTLMNTASPLLQKNGLEYSPRAQGAGLVNLESAVSQKISVSFTKNGKAKAELYDKLASSVTFDVTVKNLTDTKLDAKLSATLTNDGFTELSYGDKTEYFSTLTAEADTVSRITSGTDENLNRYAADFAPLRFTLEPGEERVISIKIAFDKAYHGKLSEIFQNGHFAEGFIYCEADGSTVSMPYLGYIGDWTAAPVIDGSPYSGETEIFDGSKFYIKVNGKYIPAGADIFSDTHIYDRNAISFSPNGDEYADTINFGATALRNCKSSKMTVTDSNGETVYTSKFPYFIKTKGMDEVTVFRFTWDGSDGIYSRYKFPDGIYNVTFEYVLDYSENAKQTYTYPVIIDTEDPSLSSASLSDGKLSLTASDNNKVMVINIYENDSADSFSLLAHGESAVFDISDYKGDSIYYEIIDYAYNINVGKLNLSELAA